MAIPRCVLPGGAGLRTQYVAWRWESLGTPRIVRIPEAEAVASFFPEPLCAGQARRFVRHEMESVGMVEPPMDAAMLLVSELVTNVMLHARTEMTVRFRISPGCLRVEVADGNSRYPVAVAAPTDATSGRGLQLVQALADNWGIDGTADGKIVWFELPLPDDGPG